MPVEIRSATVDELPSILALLRSSFGYLPDELYEPFIRWKHLANPAGVSPMWVAEDEGRLLGLRTFMRWTFERDGDAVPAVRAVDTVTAPEARGQGLFRTLTLRGIEAERAAHTAFVFNTPNDMSRPGYLKMGWREVGTLPVRLRPRSLGAAVRAARSRTAADLWSLETSVGSPATTALADTDVVEALVAAGPAARPGCLRTQRTASFLRWRYGLGALHYRAVPIEDRLEDGMVIFRLRRRGIIVEAAIADVLAPSGSMLGPTIRRLLRDTRADVAVAVGGTRVPGWRVPVGPLLTWRGLVEDDQPPLDAWDLSLGDVELF